jgi:hypothetical protein
MAIVRSQWLEGHCRSGWPPFLSLLLTSDVVVIVCVVEIINHGVLGVLDFMALPFFLLAIDL